MNTTVKNALIFTGGVIVGFASCEVLAIKMIKKYGKSRRSQSVSRCDDVIFDSYANAANTLDQLQTIIDQYACVTLGDYRDIIGLESYYADLKVGWKDLSNAKIIRVRNGWTIDMPKMITIE